MKDIDSHYSLTAASHTRNMASQRLQGKVCIVTGSSSGLGRAIAFGYAREGATIVCADLKPTARGDETAVDTDEQIRKDDGQSIFVTTDVSKGEDFANLVTVAVEKFGRIDV